MPAERLDINISTNGDFEWNFRLETNACSILDITGYGARLHIRDEEEGSIILSASHNTYITVNTTTNEFEVDIPQSAILGVKETFRAIDWRGVWDFVVFPTAASPAVDPIDVAFGKVRYRVGVTTLT